MDTINTIVDTTQCYVQSLLEEFDKTQFNVFESNSVTVILTSVCVGLLFIFLLCYLIKKCTSKRQAHKQTGSTNDEKITEISSPDGQETPKVVPRASPEVEKSEKKVRFRRKETDSSLDRIDESDSSFNGSTKSEEDIIKVKIKEDDFDTLEATEWEEDIMKVKFEESDFDFNETAKSKEDTIRAKENDWGYDEEMEAEAFRGSGVPTTAGIEEETVFEDRGAEFLDRWLGEDLKNVVDGHEPPQKNTGDIEQKCSILIYNAPLGIESEAMKITLEEIVGEEKILSISQSSKLQPTTQSFTTVFGVDISDRETAKFLVNLRPRLSIDDQELIIEEDKIKESKATEDEEHVVFIYHIPVHGCDEVILQAALEDAVGEGKVSNVRFSKSRITGRPKSVATAHCADAETAKFLVESEPKICINNQELTIEEGQTNESEEKKKRIVFISQIPPHACDDQTVLSALESRVGRGKVFDVRCLKDKNTGLGRGIATAYCADVETAKKLLRLSFKIKISGKKVKIVEYQARGEKSKDKVMKVSVSNIPATVTGEEFRAKILDVVGEVDFLEIEFPLVNDGSESEDCAFVNLMSKEAVKNLLVLHQQLEMGGSTVNIHTRHKINLYSSDDDSQGRNKDHVGYKHSRRDANADYTPQTYGDSSQNTPRDYRGYQGYRTFDNMSSSSEHSQDQGRDNFSTADSKHSSLASDSVYSSDSSDMNQGGDHQGLDDSNRGGRGRGYKKNFNRGWNNQGHGNRNRGGWKQRDDQDWRHQGRGNYSGGGGRRQRPFGFGRGNWEHRVERRGRGFRGGHGDSNFDNVDQRGWGDDQGYYEWPDRYQSQGRHDAQE